MREVIHYIAEVGDAVVIRSSSGIREGRIISFGKHCQECKYANVGIDGTIISFPNLTDMKWNPAANQWELQEEEDE